MSFLNQDVYPYYIPTNPAPNFQLPKPVLAMTKVEAEGCFAHFQEKRKEAMKEEQRRLLHGKYWRDKIHRDMFVALHRGDEYLADTIIERDKKDKFTHNYQSFPTLGDEGKVQVTGKIYAVLSDLSLPFKKSLIQGNFAALANTDQGQRSLALPPQPKPTTGPLSDDQRLPLEYILHLTDNRGRNPTMKQLRQVIDMAKEYVSEIRKDKRPTRPVKLTLDEMRPVIAIECSPREHRHSLTPGRYREHREKNNTRTTCLFAKNSGEIDYIKAINKRTEIWLKALEDAGWDPNSEEPLPWTLSSAGWTITPPARMYHYQSHNTVAGNITLYNAIGHLVGLHLDWRAAWYAWRENLGKMGEHLVHAKGSSYICMSGLNSSAAGTSTSSTRKLDAAAYQRLEARLLHRPHFATNITALEDRVMKTNRNLKLVEKVMQLKKKVIDAKTKRKAAQKSLETAKERFQLRVRACDSAMRTFIPLVDHFFEIRSIVKEHKSFVLGYERIIVQLLSKHGLQALYKPQRLRSTSADPGLSEVLEKARSLSPAIPLDVAPRGLPAPRRLSTESLYRGHTPISEGDKEEEDAGTRDEEGTPPYPDFSGRTLPEEPESVIESIEIPHALPVATNALAAAPDAVLRIREIRSIFRARYNQVFVTILWTNGTTMTDLFYRVELYGAHAIADFIHDNPNAAKPYNYMPPHNWVYKQPDRQPESR